MGVVFYIMFLLIGFLYVHMSCEDRNIYMQIWLGGLIGTLALMFGIVPVALVLGFTIPAHLVLFVIFCLPLYLFWHKEKKKLLQTVRGGLAIDRKERRNDPPDFLVGHPAGFCADLGFADQPCDGTL